MLFLHLSPKVYQQELGRVALTLLNSPMWQEYAIMKDLEES